MSEVIIYTDGSCNNTTHNKGGYGIVFMNGTIKQFCGGSYYATTSARMELLAVIKALQKCNEGDRVTVYSDNEYVVNSVVKGWALHWEKQKWIKRKNKGLWKMFLKEYRRLQENVKMKWTRGHNDDHWNEVADILAGRGANKNMKIKDEYDLQVDKMGLGLSNSKYL